MKTAQDPRHQHRINLMGTLFSWDFKKTKKPTPIKSGPKEIQEIISNLDRIDQTITKSATAWPLNQINRIDLAILRLSVFELLLEKEPPKVVIDEAVELAKEYGGESSPGFVNGVLGKVIELEKIKI
ncbi:MAG: N utilization substance protein B [Microgenomates group bacterium Gr01-1014_80]|nr:MAG: N utilization substance protein B [Microgenomates group bacterium Gr01-1014_80]